MTVNLRRSVRPSGSSICRDRSKVNCPRTIAGQVLSLADRLDSVAAFFHVGLVPTGSEDPFALRRNATAIVRIILEGNLRIELGAATLITRETMVIDDGFKGVPDSEQEGRRRMTEFIFERVRHYGRVVHALAR